MSDESPTDLLSVRDIADRRGIKPHSVRRYIGREPHPLKKPDVPGSESADGRSYWYRSTVEAWEAELDAKPESEATAPGAAAS